MWSRTHVHTSTDVTVGMYKERETTQETPTRAEERNKQMCVVLVTHFLFDILVHVY